MPDHLAQVFAQYPLPVVSAEGVWLNIRDGRRVLDLYGGHAVAALGYGHPGWTRALTEQARSCQFQTNAVPMDVRLRARPTGSCGSPASASIRCSSSTAAPKPTRTR